MSAFDRAEKSALTAVYEGHALATLPVAQDARARIAHGAQRALVARDPVTGTPVKTRLRSESMDSLRFSTARAATCFTHRDGFATAMCFARRRSLRRSRNAAIILPTTTLTRCARAPPLLRRKLLRPFSKKEGRSAPVTRATSPSLPGAVTRPTSPAAPRSVSRRPPGAPPLAAHAECGRALRAPSIASLRAMLAADFISAEETSRSSLGSLLLRRVSYPPRRQAGVHWALRPLAPATPPRGSTTCALPSRSPSARR
jgi:hypothetical protein